MNRSFDSDSIVGFSQSNDIKTKYETIVNYLEYILNNK